MDTPYEKLQRRAHYEEQARLAQALNDPTVPCCGRDAADCDCPDPVDGD